MMSMSHVLIGAVLRFALFLILINAPGLPITAKKALEMAAICLAPITLAFAMPYGPLAPVPRHNNITTTPEDNGQLVRSKNCEEGVMKQCSRRRRAGAVDGSSGRRERICRICDKVRNRAGYIRDTVSAFPTFSADIENTVYRPMLAGR
jgi:hypothetical protein